MAEFRFPIEILRNVLKPLVLMANDANIFFDPNRGLRLKLVCFIGYVDAAVFFRKESLANFQCPNRTSSSIDILEFGRALHRLGTNGLVALHFDTEELVLRLRTVRFGPLTPERLLMEPTAWTLCNCGPYLQETSCPRVCIVPNYLIPVGVTALKHGVDMLVVGCPAFAELSCWISG
ncbi:hypothetical protein CRG98_034214 [Punica granatum]|uniref:Uncharacterized protein n=1 Tax=Punica granatum TaxID=22663 RepID=A0A2I0IN16_PUNGR|nr:hypothetical protein CRG98_034214 [Punica granatum]